MIPLHFLTVFSLLCLASGTLVTAVDKIAESNIAVQDDFALADDIKDRDLAVSDPERFNIAFGFAGHITDDQRQGFVRARKKWQSVIKIDSAASVCVEAGTEMCGYKFRKATCIDDLFIGVRIQKIDGVGKIAGYAGPCAMDDTGKIRVGVMTFDAQDANNLIDMGAWDSTIMHEMGHVIGLGTMWSWNHLITPNAQGAPGPYYYTGPKGNEGLQMITGGARNERIEIEDLGGEGTARSHWKESVYDSELMTGYLEGKGKLMPFSLMTAKALEDLGYVIDETNVDEYTLPMRKRKLRSKEGKIPVGNDILNVEVKVLGQEMMRPKKGREQEYKRKKEEYSKKRNERTRGE
jgi:hypothetical protein